MSANKSDRSGDDKKERCLTRQLNDVNFGDIFDNMPDFVPGVFLELRETASVWRVYRRAYQFFRQRSAGYPAEDREFPRERLKKFDVPRIVVRYWWEYDRDNRTKDSLIKKEFADSAARMNDLILTMREVPKPVRNGINHKMKRAQFPNEAAYRAREPGEHLTFDELLHHLERCYNISKPTLDEKYTKATTKAHINSICGEMIRLWEILSQREFNRNLKWRKSTTKKFYPRFATDDADFIHIMLRAVDPDVTISQARTALQNVTKASPKMGSPQNPTL